jgi:hypothetical protein
MSITVTVGLLNKTFMAVKVYAPRRYDYADTLRVNIPGWGSVALIGKDIYPQQVARYQSGGYTLDDSFDVSEQDLAEAIFAQLYTKED